jgi:WD40 repeat protein
VDSGIYQIASGVPGFYTSLRWSPDGKWLAFVDPHYGIQVVNTSTGKLESLIYPIQETVDTLEWSPDNKQITYATRSGHLYIIDIQTLENTLLYDQLSGSTELAWSPDGRWLAVSSGSLVQHTLYLWDSQNGQFYHLNDRVRASGMLAWQP